MFVVNSKENILKFLSMIKGEGGFDAPFKSAKSLVGINRVK